MEGTLPEDRRRDLRRLGDGADVVDAEHVGALGESEHRRGDRAPGALAGARSVDLADEALARGADDDRPAEPPQLAETAQKLEVVREGLAEPDARVDPDPILGDPH